MKVLHLFSNHKWTGPAEPCLTLCRHLKAQGIDVDFACSPGPDPARNKVAAMAREWGIPPRDGMRLGKHRNPFFNWRDSRVLSRWLAAGSYDIIHCHLDNDHEIARGPAQHARVPLVRSSYEGEGFESRRRYNRLLRDTAWMFEPSQMAAEADTARFPFPRKRVTLLPGSVDLARFDATRVLPDARAKFSIPAEAFTIGIVARMQTHRHYEDLFHAFHAVSQALPQARLVVIGRGTKQEEVGFAPVRALGLENRVVFTGYLDGDDYVAALHMLDAGVFLVPGSDGTCRAVRELLAMGVPMAVADRGMLREIVKDGISGAVFDGSSAALANVLTAWGSNPSLRHQLAEAARNDARDRFDPTAQAKQVITVYEHLLAEMQG